MQPIEPMLAEPAAEPPSTPRRRTWRDKFHDALRGIKHGIRGQSSFFVHFFVAALVLAAAGILRCSLEQWCLLLICIGGVLAAEMFNSALEALFRGLDDATKERCWRSLDVAAGAVLLVSVVAVVVGILVFAQRLVQILWPE